MSARKKLVVAVIAGSMSAWLPQPASATVLPPNTRSQLLSSPNEAPTRSIPYVITPERRALLKRPAAAGAAPAADRFRAPRP